MTFRLRAVRALVLLAGFSLLGVALLVVMGVVDWLADTTALRALLATTGQVPASQH